MKSLNNNNFKKFQNFKKGGQFFLSILLLFLLFAINSHFLSVSANEQEKELFDIGSIKPNLGVFEDIPTVKDICERINELNQELFLYTKNYLKDSEISFKILNDTSLDYECEGLITVQENATKLKGQIKIYFKVKQDLNNVIQNTDLGEIQLTKVNTKESFQEVFPKAIIEKNPNLNLSDIDELIFETNTHKSGSNMITVKAPSTSLKYKGKIKLNVIIKKLKHQLLETIKEEYKLENNSQINHTKFYKKLEQEISKELKKDPNIESALKKAKEQTEKELQKILINSKNKQPDNENKKDVNTEDETDKKLQKNLLNSENDKVIEINYKDEDTSLNIEEKTENSENNKTINISAPNTNTEPKEIVKLNSKVANHQFKSFWKENNYLIYIIITSIAIVLLIVLVIFLSSFKKRNNLK
ncbi:hypothetical protein J8J04_00535 ['Fragaria x ananassa' phyllody phytoplasma]|uniref:Uncharacterized protein n=1 Tax='Fragaria x ananassa' phyllody phytoplasma TaxID=2358428 RepID=A0ABS5K2X9_9MOLU|nr:hypothetical protein ['Fragaria x ananassa' phyllody phytoplasma]MBS2126207.1 hypothetical protein ['Fragaria x ananassa' phyllody phytoplasma]